MLMHKPITGRTRSIVDGSRVHCHGGCEFEPSHRTFFELIFLLINLFIYGYNSLTFPNLFGS